MTNTTPKHHIARAGEMVDPSTELAPMVEQLHHITQMEPIARQSAEEIANILGDWYLGAVENGDEVFADALVLIANRANQISDTVQNQSAFIGALVEMANVLTEQRDGAFEELGQIDTGIEQVANYRLPAHPKLQNLFDRFADSHNEMFWESLPYDMADALGKPWEFYDADALYTAVTVDIDEVDDDGDNYGYSPAELQAFRDQLLIMVRQLTRRTQ